MLSQNQQKHVSALQLVKYRRRYRQFIVEGEKLAAELLRQSRITVAACYGSERWAAEHAALLQAFRDRFTPVSEPEMKKISALTTPTPVLVVAELPAEPLDPASLDSGFHFYLDGLQDPGNLGTVLRVADWFGFPQVFCSPDCADAFGPKVVQASMGAFLRVRTWELELPELLALAPPGLPVLGAMLDGEPVGQAALPAHGLVVIGSEGQGIRPAVEALLTRRVTIPRHPEGGAESLNAAVASGILAAALQWQRGRN